MLDLRRESRLSETMSRRSSTASNNLDRTCLVPSHTGPHVFPNSPFFGKLLRHARRNRTAIRDVDLQVEKTYSEILSDTLSLPAMIEQSLSVEVLKAVTDGRRVRVHGRGAGSAGAGRCCCSVRYELSFLCPADRDLGFREGNDNEVQRPPRR